MGKQRRMIKKIEKHEKNNMIEKKTLMKKLKEMRKVEKQKQ